MGFAVLVGDRTVWTTSRVLTCTVKGAGWSCASSGNRTTRQQEERLRDYATVLCRPRSMTRDSLPRVT